MITIIFQKNGKPIYEQIYEYIKKEIITGKELPGGKLPSKRKLAAHLSVSINTVDTAYSQLSAEGYIEPVAKKGYFICRIDEYQAQARTHVYAPPEQIITVGTASAAKQTETVTIDFSPGNIDPALFPYNAIRKIFRSIFSENDPDFLKKPDVQGDLALRRALARFLYHSRGVNCREGQIIIGSGTDHLLFTLSILLGKDRQIAFENPVYMKAYQIFENMGNEVIPIDTDDKGIRMEPLIGLTNTAVYITPSHHFPLGVSMPIDRRIKLLNYANKSDDIFIIEDDYDSEFRYNEKPLPSLQSIDQSGKVIYIGTFSKSIAPSIRISYMVLPEPLLAVYAEKYRGVSPSVSSLEQKIIAEFIDGGGYEKHIHKMRKAYKDKRELLIGALRPFDDKIKIIGENAGHHLLIKAKNGLTEAQMCETAMNHGVKVYPISPYFVNGITQRFTGKVLVGYGSLTGKQIAEGVKLLKQAWRL